MTTDVQCIMKCQRRLSEQTKPISRPVRIAEEFRRGIQLLRVTRKKARTRTFRIDTRSGTVLIDDTPKFSVDAIKDLRTGDDAKHYMELCHTAPENESLWLTIVYFIGNLRIKVLHVVCPNHETLEHLRVSLIELHQQRARFIGAGHALFGNGPSVRMDEKTWHNFMPNSQSLLESKPREMSFDEVYALCQRLQFLAPEDHLRGIFNQADSTGTGLLDFGEFKHFVERIKRREDIQSIYDYFKTGEEMTREEFESFLAKQQGTEVPVDHFFEGSSPAETISVAKFTTFILSRQNSITSQGSCDMTRPLNEYFISSSHNTYLTGRQVGDDSSIEPYIAALQKGCRCIEIDIWTNSDGRPEVRHGHAFTSAVPLEAVLKVIDKYAFIVSPWPLIISLEVRCSTRAQELAINQIRDILGSVLVECPISSKQELPSPMDLRHRIILKVKKTNPLGIHEPMHRSNSSDTDDKLYFPIEDGSRSTSAADSDSPTSFFSPSRSSSMSSHSSSYSSVSSTYRALTRATPVIDEFVQIAPYLNGLKFKNFSLPESKSFNHVFSLSERAVKHFNRETSVQVRKHNTRYMMRVYPSKARLMSSNFLPHNYWSQGIQMAAMNWQTHDLGMQINDAFFAADCNRVYSTGYQLKPAYMRHWTKGQELTPLRWKERQWNITILSGTQLMRNSSVVSPFVEVEVIRPAVIHSPISLAKTPDRDSKFKTSAVPKNGFNPRFNETITFTTYDDEDLTFTFLKFLVRDVGTNDVLGQSTVPLDRIQKGYRPLPLHDTTGEQYIFSALLIAIH